jgi:hypothetical protein
LAAYVLESRLEDFWKTGAAVKMTENNTHWKWIYQKSHPTVSIGDVALVNDVKFVCISIDDQGIATWDDANFVNIKVEKPTQNSIVTVRYITDDGKWKEMMMHEKFVERIQSDRVEWLKCN